MNIKQTFWTSCLSPLDYVNYGCDKEKILHSNNDNNEAQWYQYRLFHHVDQVVIDGGVDVDKEGVE